MKPEYNKIDRDLNGLIEEMPVDKVKELYYKKTLDSKRTLWLENNLEGYKQKEKEIEKLIDRMNYNQRLACLNKESEAFNDTLYDLRIRLRSETLEFLGVVLAMHWLIGIIREYLESYDETGINDYYDSAKDLLNELNKSYKSKYWNDETMEDMESFLESMKDAPELTEQDMEFIDSLAEYPKRYNAMKSVGLE